jgi:2-amino-4-hydroxy-6-hydroxymethyldihydropteridine diphosphokinase
MAAGKSGIVLSIIKPSKSATLGLGGNIGDVVTTMGKALDRLQAHTELKIVKISSLYKTPPWGIEDQDWFVNACVEVVSTLSPHQLLEQCLATEKHLKRKRILRWGPRTIDIDVLTYEDYESDEAKLTIPHPRMLERAFVLVPLADIAPDLIVLGNSVQYWLEGVDTGDIEKLKTDGPWWNANIN